MRSSTLAVTFAAALMSAAVLPSAAAGDNGGGFIKTVQRTAAQERPDNRAEGHYRVGKRGHGRDKGRGHYRGGKHYGHHGRHGRPVYVVPRYRFYGGPYRHDHHYYNDYLGVFLLGGVLGYHLND